jgi:hypothetical protein
MLSTFHAKKRSELVWGGWGGMPPSQRWDAWGAHQPSAGSTPATEVLIFGPHLPWAVQGNEV